jgi:hypothetical protein
MTEDDFRDFTFVNTAELHTQMNPDFFKGTVVEKEVGDLVSSGRIALPPRPAAASPRAAATA